MKDILKKILGTVAPVLAAGLGGPLAGSVVQIVANSLGIKADAPDVEDQIVAKLETATAADWLAIKESEQQFKLEMEKIGLEHRKVDVKEEEVAASDRDSARKREVSTQDRTQAYLAYAIVGTFIFRALAEVIIAWTATSIDPNLMQMLDRSLTAYVAIVMAVITYYFGSSSGSKRKADDQYEQTRMLIAASSANSVNGSNGLNGSNSTARKS